MNSPSPQSGLAEPAMQDLLALLGIDVEYVRGEGNTLHFLDETGQEVPVIDYAGGYGALVLGHNHPEVAAAAESFLRARRPVLAQASRQPAAGRVLDRLNAILHREFGTAEPYYGVFSNSGAESVEVALKHAEFDRQLGIRARLEEIAGHIEAAREAVRSGRAALPEDAGGDVEALVHRVTAANAAVAARPPLFLTLEGSFHGKLAGSVQLTHNAAYRTPFSALAAQARFVPFDQPEAITKIAEEERAVLLDLVVEGGRVRVVERDHPVFAALFMEVIQGEGGIREVTEEQARTIRRACDSIGCPVVVDEIQSGMGRTGAFFASSLIGLQADYYTLAKGLGGGVAKTALTLVRGARFRREFDLVHSSTFAKDGLSLAVTHAVLDLLEADGGAAYRRAAERGGRLVDVFSSLVAAYPRVLKEVRGKGLMLGLEFRDQSEAAAPRLRESARADMLGYVLSAYLLRAHRIRTFPTASAVNTLRFEPSIHLTDEEIAALEIALRDVCGKLEAQDETAFFGPAAAH
ncbi:aspartate aminotransferase family protein [Streptomyces sp. TS71-3]|uniref:aspartate aminotransferase family protein n=1 Tax=Streptomyces sp. TS71-3 TaxID=2733862 RepID=UPI001B29242A|nr:aminotransferase class III-fold pyridoxal phosphate-dependent enzyme [Streptomyces sp. TS71-3]GHJ40940.1 diaminobutyrate--pyruvate aminotransferase [Streptomyces sp. TS71-3]